MIAINKAFKKGIIDFYNLTSVMFFISSKIKSNLKNENYYNKKYLNFFT